MAEFVGKYEYVKDDGNFEEFLKTLGVSVIIRKIAKSTSPSIEITMKDDGTMTIKTCTTFRSHKLEFKLGIEFDEERVDGTKCKTTVSKEGNRLVQKQIADLPCEVIRELIDNKLICTFKCKNVTCIREYKKIGA